GLGTASKRNVGTGVNQIPDMNSFTSGDTWFKLPSGHIVQAFSNVLYSTDVNGTLTNYPIAFPNKLISLSAMWSDTSQTTAPTFKFMGNLSDKTKAYIKVTGGTGQFGTLIIAIGN
ncbi:gp53-like domain-containing protein, partial [Enterobacter hormaechei]|uniref:gp53-like domain-containing protein n=1 Tax=Enterobacter hormaechei TaxID=158836 RepID=UPI0033564BF2